VTAVEKYLFTPLYYPRNAWSVLRWWESRRPLYNALVGGAGFVTLGTVALLAPAPPMVRLLGGSIVYAIAANLCYSLGPAADLLLRRALDDRAPAIGPVLFRYGLAFSLGLTLLPIPIMIVGTILQRLFG